MEDESKKIIAEIEKVRSAYIPLKNISDPTIQTLVKLSAKKDDKKFKVINITLSGRMYDIISQIADSTKTSYGKVVSFILEEHLFKK